MREQLQIVEHRDDRLQEGDRRQAPRVEVRLKVEFAESDSHYMVQGVVMDISRTGMRIHTVGPVRLWQERDLRFWVYAGGNMIRIKGHVVRHPGPQELAIAFDVPGKPSQDKVEDVIEQTAVRNLRFEAVVRQYETPSPRSKSSLTEQAHEVGRKSLMTFHDSVAELRQERRSPSSRWLSRRFETHL